MALRRLAQSGRPLVRRGGGKWLAFGIQWCCEASGLSKGALIAELSWKMGVTRDQIYQVIRGNVGMPPDVIWRAGRALNELGVWWMSGPLALALEPRYDAHVIGAVGELVLEPMHFLWRGALYDFLRYRSEFRERSEFGLKCIKVAGSLSSPLQDLFESAWQRWYAFDASELGAKEHEMHFADAAPALARAVSLLRAQQRDSDSESHERSYRLLLHDVNKDIREYFEIGGYKGQPIYARRKHVVEAEPRFNLLSNDNFGQTDFGHRLQRVIAPGGKRTPPADAYRHGWHNVNVPWSSGLLALAVLDYERELYLLVARIAKEILPALERFSDGKRLSGDVETLRRYKLFWKSLWAIACLVGPLDEGLAFLSKELAFILEANFKPTLTDEVWPSIRWQVSDLHAALFDESRIGAHLRSIITLPADAARELSAYSVSSTYNPSHYETSTTPEALATVLDMLHRDEFGYPTGTTRIELFWWFRDVAALFDAVN